MCYSFIPRKFAAQPDSSETKTPAEMREPMPAERPAAVKREAATPESYAHFMESMKRWMERQEQDKTRA